MCLVCIYLEDLSYFFTMYTPAWAPGPTCAKGEWGVVPKTDPCDISLHNRLVIIFSTHLNHQHSKRGQQLAETSTWRARGT